MRRVDHIKFLAFLLCTSFVASAALADRLESVVKKYEWEVSPLSNSTTADQRVVRHTVNAGSKVRGFRLHFVRRPMGKDGIIRILTPRDRQVITLNDRALKAFQYSTPYLNGDRAIIEFWVRARSSSDGIAIHSIEALFPRVDQRETICGQSDDRVPSNIEPVARMLATATSNGGCTGTLISENCMVSAGHCIRDLNIAQFNVPRSNRDRTANHPRAEDQYPLAKIYDSEAVEGFGGDWAVYRIQPNPITGKTAGSVQGAFKIRTVMPRVGEVIRITGFGIDDGEANVIQQTHAAEILRIDGSTLYHNVDTMRANSGAAIIHEQSKEILGVHTHGGCGDGGDSNKGTMLLGHRRFRDAIAQCLRDERREGFRSPQ